MTEDEVKKLQERVKRLSKPSNAQTDTIPSISKESGSENPVVNKYRNKRCVVDGIKFQSIKEGTRYGVLKLMQKEGLISNLMLQVSYDLIVNGILICRYRADFEYYEKGVKITEDTKGCVTDIFRIKRALMKACHGIEIKET